MATATAVVNVVGLVLLSFQIEPGKLVAIAPRIPCPAQDRTELSSSMQKRTRDAGPVEPSAADVMRAANVEEHAATLLIPAGDYRSNNGWAPALVGGTYYVRLDGERIRFIPSPRASRRANVETKVVNESNDLGLPHLGCCRIPQLREEYMPPNYQLAAAVVDFSGGRAHACDQPYQRQDTIVYFDNGGTLTIEAKKGTTTKQIIVDGGAHLTVQNMPTGALPSALRASAACAGAGGGNGDHRGAMRAMVKKCDQPMPCPTNGKTGHDCTQPAPSIDARCSNNQWP